MSYEVGVHDHKLSKQLPSDAPAEASTAKELAAGCIGGIVQVLVGQPFDTVKVRLQTQPTPPVYSGAADCVRKILSQEGPAAFYKGTLTPLVGIGACVSVQFGALEYAKRTILSLRSKNGQQRHQLTPGELFVAGSFSGLANSFLAGPIEHVRIRLQIQKKAAPGTTTNTAVGEVKPYAGPLDFLRRTYAEHGVAGVFKGQGITILRELIGYGVYFSVYEVLVQKEIARLTQVRVQSGLEGSAKRSDVASYKLCGYGGFSGCFLWLFIYPIDMTKTRIQTDGFAGPSRRFSSAADCFKKTLAENGVRGMYRGFAPCFVRAGPANAATFVAYETAMSYLNK